MSRRVGRWVVAGLVVFVVALGVTAFAMAQESPGARSGFDVPAELQRCRHEIRAWLDAHPRFAAEANVKSWSCVWDVGSGSGGYRSDGRHIDIKPWGMYHWGIEPATWYAAVLQHEWTHAWDDHDGRLKGREAEYAAIRGVTLDSVNEDAAEMSQLDAGVYLNWGDPRVNWIPESRPSDAQLAQLRASGFLPPRG